MAYHGQKRRSWQIVQSSGSRGPDVSFHARSPLVTGGGVTKDSSEVLGTRAVGARSSHVLRAVDAATALHGSRSPARSAFLDDHAGEVLARDFFVMVTAPLRRVYVLLVVDIIVRPIVHALFSCLAMIAWPSMRFASPRNP